MKYTYLDYLAENEAEYFRLLPYSIVLILASLLFAIGGFFFNDYDLSDHIRVEGEVTELKKIEVTRDTGGPRGISGIRKEKAILPISAAVALLRLACN